MCGLMLGITRLSWAYLEQRYRTVAVLWLRLAEVYFLYCAIVWQQKGTTKLAYSHVPK